LDEDIWDKKRERASTNFWLITNNKKLKYNYQTIASEIIYHIYAVLHTINNIYHDSRSGSYHSLKTIWVTHNTTIETKHDAHL